MTREEAERKIRSVFTIYFQFAGNREADEVIEALRQEPCEDCISRQTVLDAVESDRYDYEALDRYVKDLPSVTPQSKTGRWIDGKCNRCGTHAPYWAMSSTYYCSEYCPKCGTKMENIKHENH